SRLELSDHGGVGLLQLCDDTRRLASWRFTLACLPGVQRLAERFEAARSAASRPCSAAEAGGAAIDAAWTAEEADEVEDRPRDERPSTWHLLRLWRFARPYRRRLLLGFLLTLASTAATLVPPYMTMPLMDDILIPHQNGKPIDTGLVALYLGGLFGASLLAWILGWARTYVLALVSERIGADLRAATFDHLIRLSLSYFGGKRTGDLMARIGAETDRLNLFMSVQLLD